MFLFLFPLLFFCCDDDYDILLIQVVELLACYLEREPSLPKRVDLFFLVDSIMQCSRVLKGKLHCIFCWQELYLNFNVTGPYCITFRRLKIYCFPGEIGDLYSSAIEALLPRFLLAAAPSGSNGQENRRECLKVCTLDLFS